MATTIYNKTNGKLIPFNPAFTDMGGHIDKDTGKIIIPQGYAAFRAEEFECYFNKLDIPKGAKITYNGLTLYVFARLVDPVAKAIIAAATGTSGEWEAEPIVDDSITNIPVAKQRAIAAMMAFGRAPIEISFSTKLIDGWESGQSFWYRNTKIKPVIFEKLTITNVTKMPIKGRKMRTQWDIQASNIQIKTTDEIESELQLLQRLNKQARFTKIGELV